MDMKGFPTSSDIYLELDGKKVAVVQSYSVKATSRLRAWRPSVKASRWPPSRASASMFWSLPVSTPPTTPISDGINFYELQDFSLVICKPDRRIIYSGCEWSAIEEDGQLNAMVAEKITVVASKRIEASA